MFSHAKVMLIVVPCSDKFSSFIFVKKVWCRYEYINPWSYTVSHRCDESWKGW